MDSDEFFDQGGERPDVVAGRYRLPHPETGEERSWTRATTHAELPEDSYALTRWMLRQLLLGLHRRPDLLRLVESWSDAPDRSELDQVITTAHEVAGNDAKANLGTAVHGVLQRVDRAWIDLGVQWPTDGWLTGVGVPEWALPHAQSYVAELRRHGLRPIPSMVERRVVNLDLGCAGTLDNLYEEADGTVVLGDKKTGRLDYPERKYAIQLAVYHGSSHLLDPDGGPPVDLRSIGLRREYAVLVYVDPESGACSVYRVDMRRAQYGANLAAQVREWRRERHFLLPYVEPGVQPAEQWRAADRTEGGRHLTAVPNKPTRLPGEPPSPWLAEPDARINSAQDPVVVPSDPMVGETRNVGQQEVRWDGAAWVPVDLFDANGTAIPAVPTDPGTHAVSGGLVDDPGNEHSANSITWTEDALMKLSKAALQGVLRGLDPGASVAHQRKILVGKIMTLQGGGRVATTTPSDQTTWSTSRQSYAAKDPAELPAGPIGGAEDPSDPRTAAFRRARLAEIAAAPSVAELGRIHAAVTRLGGDQAWTDGMTKAARARTAYLDSVQARKIEWRGEQLTPDQAVAAAGSSQDMAQVWNLVTVGGSDEAAWTTELNELAHARLAALQAAAEQRHPSTPFGEA